MKFRFGTYTSPITGTVYYQVKTDTETVIDTHDLNAAIESMTMTAASAKTVLDQLEATYLVNEGLSS